tara:strand:+ start:132 stop:518 length:387 start_codon:yes stop_codon:yes gene_type:complete
MGYPTGSGSEILARTTINAQSNTETSFRWDGTMATTGTNSYTVPALHIITVISVTACEAAGAAGELINLTMNDGSNDINIIKSVALGAALTFVFSDKLVLIGGDKLIVNCDATANIDFICNYIDQDWT